MLEAGEDTRVRRFVPGMRAARSPARFDLSCACSTMPKGSTARVDRSGLSLTLGFREPTMYRKVFANKVFDRKVVLITGGCAGIGRALAMRLAQAGARLVILDLQQAALDSLVQHLADHHNAEALGLVCDVAEAEAVQRAVALAVERFGGIDVLVNNAGITHRSTFTETSLEVFQRVMAVNYFGALHCTQAALPSLIARSGQVIVLSSLSGIAPCSTAAPTTPASMRCMACSKRCATSSRAQG